MMGDFVTFFRDHDLDSGSEHTVKMQDQQGLLLFRVYTRARADLSAFNDHMLQTKGAQAVFAELKKEIAKGGGGLVANAADRTAQITVIGSQGYPTPTGFTLLQPGFPPRAIPASSDKIPLPEAGHLIVPVDQAAQSNLEKMLSFLRWYSPDVESQVLDAIRQPSLDARVADLEDRVPKQDRATRLQGAAAAEGSNRFHRFLSWSRRTVSDTKLGGPLLTALLLAALLLNYFIFDSRMETLEEGIHSLQVNAGIAPPQEPEKPEDETEKPPEEAAEPSAGAASQPAAPANRSAGTANQPAAASQRPAAGANAAAGSAAPATGTLAKQLIMAVRAKAPFEPRSASGILWQTHFSKINDVGRLDEWSEAQQKALYQDSTFLWGAMKLAIAQSGAAPSSTTYLNGTRAWTATKAVLREATMGSFDRKIVDMFAACGCRIFPNRNRPSIQPTTSGEDAELHKELLFANGPCQNYQEAQLDAGIELLLEKLRS